MTTDDAHVLRIERQVVVPDVSWLYARPFDREHLPNVHQYLLSEVALREAVTATKDPERRAAKLTSLLRKNCSKLLVGRYWWDIQRDESSPNASSSLQDVVHWDLTRDARDMNAVSDSVHRSRAKDLIAEGPVAAYEAYRQWTVQLAEMFIDYSRRNDPESMRHIHEPGVLRAKVRNPRTIVELVVGGFAECSSSEWREALAVFPDRLAIARWHRLVAWIAHEALRRGSTPLGREMRNFFDDAHYAFLASYAGTLVTRDEGMARMTKDIFPTVRVLRDLPDERWPLDD